MIRLMSEPMLSQIFPGPVQGVDGGKAGGIPQDFGEEPVAPPRPSMVINPVLPRYRMPDPVQYARPRS